MPRAPRTYDEITRQTVVDPDLSFRPTPEQMAEGHLGERALFGDERALSDRVRAALVSSGHAVDGFAIEVNGAKVALRGTVRDAATLRAIEQLVSNVEGVEAFDDHLVVG